jgi:hypothetical protein
VAFLIHFDSFGGLLYYILNIEGLNRKRLVVWGAFLYFSLNKIDGSNFRI